MKLNAVGVITSNPRKTIEFYKILGFEFGEVKPDEDHFEPVNQAETRLMFDSVKLMQDILGEEPNPANHSAFAIEYDSPEEVNEVAQKIEAAGFNIFREPWDASWGQRYCIVQDPDGYKIDLYAKL